MANFISMIKWPERVLVTYAGVKEIDVQGVLGNSTSIAVSQAALICHMKDVPVRLRQMQPGMDAAFLVSQVRGELVVVDAMQQDVGERWTYLCEEHELPCSEREFMAFLTGKVEAAMQISYPAPPPWVTR